MGKTRNTRTNNNINNNERKACKNDGFQCCNLERGLQTKCLKINLIRIIECS